MALRHPPMPVGVDRIDDRVTAALRPVRDGELERLAVGAGAVERRDVATDVDDPRIARKIRSVPAVLERPIDDRAVGVYRLADDVAGELVEGVSAHVGAPLG